MFKLFLISVVILFIIELYRKNINKMEITSNLRDIYKNINMEDFQRNNGGIIILNFFLLIIVIINFLMTKMRVDAKVSFIFCSIFFAIIILSWISTLGTRRNIIKIIKAGKVVKGIITREKKVQGHDDLFPSYYYYCKFEIEEENGEKTEINASFPEKVETLFAEGDIVEIICLKEKTIKCMELPNDKEIEMFFSKKYQIVNIIIEELNPQLCWGELQKLC